MERKKLSAYLPTNIYDLVASVQKDRGLKSLSEAAEQIFREHFGLVHTKPTLQPDVVHSGVLDQSGLERRIQDLEARVEALEARRSDKAPQESKSVAPRPQNEEQKHRESNIKAAIARVGAGEAIRTVARELGVPATTLRRRLGRIR
jgi:hypothetical protein